MQESKGQHDAIGVNQTATIELPVTNIFGIADFPDFLNEIQRQYNVEKNIKNNLYSFILSNGLYDKLKEFHKTRNLSTHDAHCECVEFLLTNENSPLNK